MIATKKSVTVSRGDVVLAWYPFASGQGAKRRPCVVIQNDQDNAKLDNTVVVQITSNLQRRGDKSHVLVETATPDGQQTGLLFDSLISCNNLATIETALIDKRIGTLAPATLQQVHIALKAALELP
jgi:mRNA interferase MazF